MNCAHVEYSHSWRVTCGKERERSESGGAGANDGTCRGAGGQEGGFEMSTESA